MVWGKLESVWLPTLGAPGGESSIRKAKYAPGYKHHIWLGPISANATTASYTTGITSIREKFEAAQQNKQLYTNMELL